MDKSLKDSRLLLSLIQFVILLALINAVNTQVWYTGQVDVEYTDGMPEGSGLEVELEVDSMSADGKIHIDGFLTYMNWQNTRNDTTLPAESEDSNYDGPEFKSLSEVRDEVDLFVKLSVAISLLFLPMTLLKFRLQILRELILSSIVLWIILLLVIFAPLGYLGGMDLGDGSFSDDDDEGDSMIHESSDGGMKVDVFNGELVYEFTSSSYDLGLIDGSEMNESLADPPGQEHRSYLEMDGSAGIYFGGFVVDLIWAWALLFVFGPIVLGLISRTRVEKPQLL